MADEGGGDFEFTPTGLAAGFALGAGFGASMWVAFDDPALAISLGLSMGLAFAVALSAAEGDD
jgi:hypothetical protein